MSPEEVEVRIKYKELWKDIVENEDGTLNKEQVMKELFDFSTIVGHCAKLYCLATGHLVSNPMTKPESVFQVFQEMLQEKYDEGYKDGCEDSK